MLSRIEAFLNHLSHRKQEMPVKTNRTLSLTGRIIEVPSISRIFKK